MSPTRSVPNEHRRTRRILVADADGDTRLLYREWLDASGSDVVDAVDGRDAMVKALSVRPTLVITELRLPIFDGYALCEVLRRDSLTKTVPIVVVTTESGSSEVDRARGRRRHTDQTGDTRSAAARDRSPVGTAAACD